MTISKVDYRNGGEGMIQWVEDNIFASIVPPGKKIKCWVSMSKLPKRKNPKTGKSYWQMWQEQKKIFRECLRMEDGDFVYSLIVFCWMRGDGKSFDVCLIQLWKFCCFPEQWIVLGANSKDQTKFVHYDIMRDIILNSPKLKKFIGEHNIQEKEIALRLAGQKKPTSFIRPISSFSGIVSNITGYTFSEIFDTKNPKFFEQLDGSIRNTPHALGVIDSTVSKKDHKLYELYQGCINKKTKKVYFSYRCSPNASPDDFWHPNMDQAQLDDYKHRLGLSFDQYFKNTWDSAKKELFSEEMIDEMECIGADGIYFNHARIKEIIKKRKKLALLADSIQTNLPSGAKETREKRDKLALNLIPVTEVYSLKDKYDRPQMATMDDLEKLGDIFDTDWAILGGADISDPEAVRSPARTIASAVAKGMVGSRSNPNIIDDVAARYIYFVLHLEIVEKAKVALIKEIMGRIHQELDGLDSFCSERYGSWDMSQWCADNDVFFESVYPNYARQKASFYELYALLDEGRFKCPTLAIQGSKMENILREELLIFEQTSKGEKNGWFGSPEKDRKHGVQDDAIYSVGWTIYGGREITVDDFRPRKGAINFGTFVPNQELLGQY